MHEKNFIVKSFSRNRLTFFSDLVFYIFLTCYTYILIIGVWYQKIFCGSLAKSIPLTLYSCITKNTVKLEEIYMKRKKQ